jgi:hypothetical protein
MVTEAMPESGNYQKQPVFTKQPKDINASGGNASVIFTDNRCI